MRKNLLSKALSIFTAALVGAACIASPSFTALAAEEETAEYTYTVYPMFAAGENEYYGDGAGTVSASSATFSEDGTYTVSINAAYDAEAIDLLLLDSDINLYKFGDAAHADNDTVVELSGLKVDVNYIEFTSTGTKYLCENDDDSSTVPCDSNGTTLRKNIYNTWTESVVTDIDPAAHPITAGETIVVSFTISGLDGRNPDPQPTVTGTMTSTADLVATTITTATQQQRPAFTFETSKNIIETGETILVSIYDTSTGEKWDGEELPEYVVEDESVLSVSAGASNGTFVITGLTAGTTYIRFTNEDSAYADFKITVKQAPTGSTTAAMIVGMSFEPSTPQLAVGETITIDMFSRMSDNPYTGAFPTYIIGDPSIVSIAPGQTESTLEMTGLSAGTTTIHFVPLEGTADMRVIVTEDGAATVTTINTDGGRLDDMLCTPQDNEMRLGESLALNITWNSGESYDGGDLEFEFADYECVEITETDSPDTYLLTAIKTGRTTVIFRNADGDAGFFTVNVTEPETTTVTTTITVPDLYTTTATTTTATTGTGDIYTTTGYAIQLACSEDNVTLYPGHTQSFYLYYKTGPTSFSESYPVTFEFENEGIAAVTPDPDGGTSDYIIEALSVGTTKLTIKQQYGYTTLTCEMNITVKVQTTTTAPVTNVPSETTYITTAAPALVCSPSAVTVEAGKRQLIELSFTSGMNMREYPAEIVSDNESVAAAVKGDYSWCMYIDGIAEGTANITITPPYGYDPVTIPVTVVPDDGDDTNNESVHVVIEGLPNFMHNMGAAIDWNFGEYSVYRFNGSRVEKIHNSIQMPEEAENVTIDASAYDSMTPGYYDISVIYADADGYTDTAVFTVAVYDSGEPVTTTVTTETTEYTGTIYTTETTTTTLGHTTTILTTGNGNASEETTVNLTTANTEITTTTVMGIVLSDSEIELEAGQRTSIHISKADGSDYFDGYMVECTSDNPAVAVVQYSDIPYTIYVVGMAEGTANITVYDPAYGSTANLQVTVTGTADNTIGKDVSIVIDSVPLKLQYNIGEELDLTGGVYRVVMDSTGDNFYGPWDMTAGRIITDAFDSTTAGTYPIYISYNNPIYGYWDVYVFYVTVADAGAETTGDIDANGKIDLDDAAAALTCYAKNAAGIATTTPEEADVDGNGKVDLDDAAYILTYYARNAAGLPCTWDDIITG